MVEGLQEPEDGVENEPERLMARAKAGDDEAFASLVRLYQRRVFAVAYRFLQNRVEAEDAAQEAFVRVFRARMSFREGSSFSAWLYTIVNRVCLNLLRHRRRHPGVSIDEHESDYAPALKDDRQEGGLNILVSEELRNLVRQAVSDLPETEKMAVILDHWEEMSLQEIAAVLDKSIPAVKSILFRTRAKLKIKLAAFLDLETAR